MSNRKKIGIMVITALWSAVIMAVILGITSHYRPISDYAVGFSPWWNILILPVYLDLILIIPLFSRQTDNRIFKYGELISVVVYTAELIFFVMLIALPLFALHASPPVTGLGPILITAIIGTIATAITIALLMIIAYSLWVILRWSAKQIYNFHVWLLKDGSARKESP
ncbi:MAG: hypothetical protein M1334_01995 [Patescibacteria group bacterium]|nr:hypothetical protein [Patescibacteria group bacterium]